MSVFILYPLASLLQESEFYGFPTSRSAPQFELRDAQGEFISAADYRGRYVYLMFGYLRCVDVCHTQVFTLNSISSVLARDDIEFVYLAMDETDKPSTLSAYFDQYGDNFTSLHASNQKQMQALASAFNAGFQTNGKSTSGNYSIDHPARIFLIDPEGVLRLTYSGKIIDAYKVAEDYHHLTSINS